MQLTISLSSAQQLGRSRRRYTSLVPSITSGQNKGERGGTAFPHLLSSVCIVPPPVLRKPAISLKRGKIGPRLLLMTSIANIFKTRASFGAHHENLNEDRLHYQRRRCSPMTLDSGNIRFMWIIAVVLKI